MPSHCCVKHRTYPLKQCWSPKVQLKFILQRDRSQKGSRTESCSNVCIRLNKEPFQRRVLETLKQGAFNCLGSIEKTSVALLLVLSVLAALLIEMLTLVLAMLCCAGANGVASVVGSRDKYAKYSAVR